MRFTHPQRGNARVTIESGTQLTFQEVVADVTRESLDITDLAITVADDEDARRDFAWWATSVVSFGVGDDITDLHFDRPVQVDIPAP